MWLSKMAAKTAEEQPTAGMGQVTISGENPAVMTGCEYRRLPVIGPGGVLWMPQVGSQALVIKTGDGYALAGVVEDNGGLEPGELMLKTDGCSIKLSGEGIYLDGKVFINGNEVE